MVARKSAPAAETTPDVSPPEPTPEPPPEPAPASAPAAPEPEPEPAPEPVPAPEPIRKYQIQRPEPPRAGGYVLTERGWVLDTEQEK